MEQPSSIKIVLISASIGLFINIIDLFRHWKGATRSYELMAMNKVLLIYLALTIVYSTILYFFYKQKKWARIALITITIITFPTHILPLFSAKIYIQMTQGIHLITSIICLIYLFNKHTKQWFNNGN